MYRDLLWFEERLRLHAARVHGRKQRYQIAMGLLFLLLLYLLYLFAFHPPMEGILGLSHKGMILILALSIIGLYYSPAMREADG